MLLLLFQDQCNTSSKFRRECMVNFGRYIIEAAVLRKVPRNEKPGGILRVFYSKYFAKFGRKVQIEPRIFKAKK